MAKGYFDYNVLVTDGDGEVMICPWQPVNTDPLTVPKAGGPANLKDADRIYIVNLQASVQQIGANGVGQIYEQDSNQMLVTVDMTKYDRVTIQPSPFRGQAGLALTQGKGLIARVIGGGIMSIYLSVEVK